MCPTVLVLLVLVFMLGVVDYGCEKLDKREAREIIAGNPLLLTLAVGFFLTSLLLMKDGRLRALR